MAQDQRPAATPRRSHGSHLAIAAIAAFLLLLVFVLFYRGDRPPTDEPLPMSAEEQAAARGPIPASEPPASELPGIEPWTPDEGARATAESEPTASLPRQKRPRADLRRPNDLDLGPKPAEQPIAGRSPSAARAAGRAISADEIRRVVGD